ncbi:MAG: hypothetical protein LBC90_01540 [Candidatus Adiutrix sp.]|jgi:hypothetical protein|nr:hypothetical protein [Candidatus Adiutrix sp.]
MTNINNMLFSIQNQAPALLQVGGGKAENYQNLAALTEQWWGEGQWLGSATDRAQDMVTLAYQGIGQKVISDMAALTAEAIREEPGLDNDYLIILIETEKGREARVFRRSEILAGLDEGLEKTILEAQMAANPLQVFESSQGLPPGFGDPACQRLAEQLNAFLKTNAKTLSTLNSAGFNPFLDHQGSSAVLKALTAYTASA